MPFTSLEAQASRCWHLANTAMLSTSTTGWCSSLCVTQRQKRHWRGKTGVVMVWPAVTMPVPDLTLYAGPQMLSLNAELRGEHLVAAQYEALPDRARQELAELAERLLQFYLELHRTVPDGMEAACAKPIKAWMWSEEILRQFWPVLPERLFAYADNVIAEWQNLPNDPYGMTYGFSTSTSGTELAHAVQRPNDVYDLPI